MYYGGKQKLASHIISLIPRHKLCCESCIGGAAIFFANNPIGGQ
ncbi:DNA adenine methylase [Sphingobacterium sp. CZ-UAM]